MSKTSMAQEDLNAILKICARLPPLTTPMQCMGEILPPYSTYKPTGKDFFNNPNRDTSIPLEGLGGKLSWYDEEGNLVGEIFATK